MDAQTLDYLRTVEGIAREVGSTSILLSPQPFGRKLAWIESSTSGLSKRRETLLEAYGTCEEIHLGVS